jgi:hypothetical protein
MGRGESKSARSAWKSSRLGRKWGGWSAFASSIASAFGSGGGSRGWGVVPCMFSMSDGLTSAAKETIERWLDVIRIPFFGVFFIFGMKRSGQSCSVRSGNLVFPLSLSHITYPRSLSTITASVWCCSRCLYALFLSGVVSIRVAQNADGVSTCGRRNA